MYYRVITVAYRMNWTRPFEQWSTFTVCNDRAAVHCLAIGHDWPLVKTFSELEIMTKLSFVLRCLNEN